MDCVESMAVMSQPEVITLDDIPDFVSFADAAETAETGVLADMERRMIANHSAGNRRRQGGCSAQTGYRLEDAVSQDRKVGVKKILRVQAVVFRDLRLMKPSS
jgi:hypothetical protein